jgi:hypothetical protein
MMAMKSDPKFDQDAGHRPFGLTSQGACFVEQPPHGAKMSPT